MKGFVYDHSYWSVDPRDDHYTSQEMVSRYGSVPRPMPFSVAQIMVMQPKTALACEQG